MTLIRFKMTESDLDSLQHDRKWPLNNSLLILGNTYSDHLREIISACIQTESIKRPDISQIRFKCEQILHVIQQQTLQQQSS